MTRIKVVEHLSPIVPVPAQKVLLIYPAPFSSYIVYS